MIGIVLFLLRPVLRLSCEWTVGDMLKGMQPVRRPLARNHRG